MKKKTIMAYINDEPLVDVVQAALDNNLTVGEIKDLLVRENSGKTITFKVE